MSVILRKRKNADGSTTLRLDIYHNGRRYYETLKNLKLTKPANLADREKNKEFEKQAKAIAVARAAELEANEYNIDTTAAKKTVVVDWLQSYVDGYKKKDKRNMQGSLNRFKDFLAADGKTGLTFGKLTPLLIEDFIDYLQSKSTGEGASSYYARFKKMIKAAYRKNMLRENILDKVEKTTKGKADRKDILTIDEITVLASTPTESSEVRRAFLFTCSTGLRWIDINGLQWKHISGSTLCMSQSKTEKDVSIPLNETALTLLGDRNDPEDFVFNLPTANGANKTLKAWVKRAGIEKKITWHNGRHSFGTALIFFDTDVVTASRLLGHSSLKHTQRYVDTAQELKEKATSKLNFDL